VVETTHRPLDLCDSDGGTTPLDVLAGRPVAAFCGLGNPEAFRRTLLGLGADLRAFRTFPDHHPYTRADVEDLRAWAAVLDVDRVVTTQKDLVKVRLVEVGGRPLAALRVRLGVEAGQDVLDRTLEAVAGAGLAGMGEES
jgi:tetraacyldisaccharide 4'-kinase